MLYKYRYSEKTYDDVAMDGAESIISWTQRRYPTLYKLLYKCEQDELVWQRKLISCVFGLLYGFAMIFVIMNTIPFISEYRDTASLFVTMFFGGAFAYSVQFRCITLLVVPTLLHGLGKWFFYLLLVKKVIFNALISKFTETAIKLVKMLCCFYEFRTSYDAWIWRQRLGPIGSVFLDLATGEVPQKWGQVQRLGLDRATILGKLNDLQQSGLNTSSINSACTDLQDQVYYKCKGLIEDMPTGFVLFTLHPLFAFGKRALCRRLVGEQLENACKTLETTFKAAVSTVNETVQEVMDTGIGDFNVNQMFEIAEGEEVKISMWDTMDDVYQDMFAELTATFMFFNAIRTFLEVIIIVLFFLGFYQALNYHYKYLSDTHFDNDYVDRYFRHVDNRRKAQKKIHLLPLRGADMKELKYLFSPIMSERELTDMNISAGLITMFGIGAAGLIYVNYLLVDFVNFLAAGMQFTFETTIQQENKPKYTNWRGGANAFTWFLNYFAEMAHYETDYSNWMYDMHVCAQTVEHSAWYEYVSVVVWCLTLLGVFSFSIYLARTRKLICDYFYHRYSKERTLELYNYRLRNRKLFVEERRQEVANIVDRVHVFGNEFDYCYTYGPKTFPQSMNFFYRVVLGYYDIFQAKRCFVCNEHISLPYIACHNKACKLLYHEQCYYDMGNACLSCRLVEPNSRYVLIDNGDIF